MLGIFGYVRNACFDFTLVIELKHEFLYTRKDCSCYSVQHKSGRAMMMMMIIELNEKISLVN